MSENAMYELGLIYVCLRNICMAASSILSERADFSRYSPFNLRGFSPVFIQRAEYELAMACRMVGQRGLTPPSPVEPPQVADIYARLESWSQRLGDIWRTRDERYCWAVWTDSMGLNLDRIPGLPDQ